MTVVGGGMVGESATEIAVGMGADVTVVDRDPAVLDRIATRFGAAVHTLYSTTSILEEAVLASDVVIGAVLVRGARTPKLVSRELVRRMAAGSVLVDVAIDQGGCFETSRPTTHSEPTFVVDDVVHYCVANMPGGVPKTSTYALNNVTLPFAIALANKGAKQALLDDEHLRNGLNVHAGKITYREVAEDLGYDYVDPISALES